MNEKCKYCDYVSKCSRICEYDSIICKVHRSFPKVVDKSYEQLQQENKQLKCNWNKLREYIRKNIIYDDVGMKILDPSPLEDYMQELEKGSESE